MIWLKDKKSLIIYFSRADENYSVGYVEKGNTEYIAEYVKENTWSRSFWKDGDGYVFWKEW